MAQWSGDGTQDPGPPPLHGDPLSGLVTGGRQEQEAFRVRVVEPSLPDISAVREAMAAVLDDESELLLGAPPSDNGPSTSELPKVSDPADTVDAEPATPPAPAASPPPVAAPRKKAASGVIIPAQRTAEPSTAQPPRRGFSPGIAAIVALLAVIAVLAIIAVASLIDTIASLFS